MKNYILVNPLLKENSKNLKEQSWYDEVYGSEEVPVVAGDEDSGVAGSCVEKFKGKTDGEFEEAFEAAKKRIMADETKNAQWLADSVSELSEFITEAGCRGLQEVKKNIEAAKKEIESKLVDAGSAAKDKLNQVAANRFKKKVSNMLKEYSDILEDEDVEEINAILNIDGIAYPSDEWNSKEESYDLYMDKLSFLKKYEASFQSGSSDWSSIMGASNSNSLENAKKRIAKKYAVKRKKPSTDPVGPGNNPAQQLLDFLEEWAGDLEDGIVFFLADVIGGGGVFPQALRPRLETAAAEMAGDLEENEDGEYVWVNEEARQKWEGKDGDDKDIGWVGKFAALATATHATVEAVAGFRYGKRLVSYGRDRGTTRKAMGLLGEEELIGGPLGRLGAGGNVKIRGALKAISFIMNPAAFSVGKLLGTAMGAAHERWLGAYKGLYAGTDVVRMRDEIESIAARKKAFENLYVNKDGNINQDMKEKYQKDINALNQRLKDYKQKLIDLGQQIDDDVKITIETPEDAARQATGDVNSASRRAGGNIVDAFFDDEGELLDIITIDPKDVKVHEPKRLPAARSSKTPQSTALVVRNQKTGKPVKIQDLKPPEGGGPADSLLVRMWNRLVALLTPGGKKGRSTNESKLHEQDKPMELTNIDFINNQLKDTMEKREKLNDFFEDYSKTKIEGLYTGALIFKNLINNGILLADEAINQLSIDTSPSKPEQTPVGGVEDEEKQVSTPVNENKIRINKSKLIDLISEQVREQTQTIEVDKAQLIAFIAEEAQKQISRKK